MPEMGGVRDYNRIRRFLSHIYLYGFFSREDFARSGIGSAKDYDYGMKLIRAIFPDSDQAALWRDGRKYPRFVRNRSAGTLDFTGRFGCLSPNAGAAAAQCGAPL